MLVSSIARFNANSAVNNAVFQSANNQNNMQHAFGGERELSLLNEMNIRLPFSTKANKLLTSLQNKFSRHHNEEIKKTIDTIA